MYVILQTAQDIVFDDDDSSSDNDHEINDSNNNCNNGNEKDSNTCTDLLVCCRYQSLNLTHVPEHSVQIYEFR